MGLYPAPSGTSTRVASGAAALAAYQAFAPVYDRFTEHYAHEAWLANIDALVRLHGAGGGRLLDVACGTGKSFLPMLSRGWDVMACDLSPAMVARAQEKLRDRPERASVFVADMRRLPPEIGPFDVATCLDDAFNFLLTAADLNAAMSSIATVLRPGGLLVFDLNSRAAYAAGFDDEVIESGDDVEFRISAGDADRPGLEGLYEIRVDAVERRNGGEKRHLVRQLQRYFDRQAVETACAEAGMSLIDLRGQVPGGRLVPEADEDVHPKILYVARREGGAS